MIVCKSEKELANATNAGDAAGAVAVKDYVAKHSGADLTPNTKVKVGSTDKTLQAYVESVSKDVAETVSDVSSNITVTVTDTDWDIRINYAYQIGKLLFIQFYGESASSVDSGEVLCRGAITGLNLKSNNVSVLCAYDASYNNCMATLTSSQIEFKLMQLGTTRTDDGGGAIATFVVLLN